MTATMTTWTYGWTGAASVTAALNCGSSPDPVTEVIGAGVSASTWLTLRSSRVHRNVTNGPAHEAAGFHRDALDGHLLGAVHEGRVRQSAHLEDHRRTGAIGGKTMSGSFASYVVTPTCCGSGMGRTCRPIAVSRSPWAVPPACPSTPTSAPPEARERLGRSIILPTGASGAACGVNADAHEHRLSLARRRHSSAVEQLFRKQQVLGSNPSVGSTPPLLSVGRPTVSGRMVGTDPRVCVAGLASGQPPSPVDTAASHRQHEFSARA